MRNQVVRAFAGQIAAGLQRKSVTTCSRWACKYRVMGKPFPGPWTFRYHPWLREMHDCDSDMWIGQKSAQMGFTETVLNRVFFKMDVDRIDSLYVLPAKNPDASDFSSGRFDQALDLSDHLKNLFSDVKNVGHKRAGATNLYIRGSRSKSGLKSIPVGLIILDELEEMDQDNIGLALERQSGQMEKQTIAISTPRIKGSGINFYFEESTQEHFYFVCPCCGKFTELTFPECLEVIGESPVDPRVEESFLKCRECGNRLEHKAKPQWLGNGRWVPSFANRVRRGFYINQLYGCTNAVSPPEIAKAYLRAQTNPADEQEFHNSKLGLTHTVKGAQVTDEEIHCCLGQYKNGQAAPESAVLTMGIDQGKWIHYEINAWYPSGRYSSSDLNLCYTPKVIDCNKVLNFEDLDRLMAGYRVNFCVIDGQPETRKALEFAYRFPGFVKLCYYGKGVAGKTIIESKDEPKITVDRTVWLDLSLGRFKYTNIQIPMNAGYEYKDHIKALTRTYERDKDGNVVGRYVKPESTPDHFAHARNYSEIALPFALSMGQSQNTVSPR